MEWGCSKVETGVTGKVYINKVYECLTTMTPGRSCCCCCRWNWTGIFCACWRWWWWIGDGLRGGEETGRNSKLMGWSSSSELRARRFSKWCFNVVTGVDDDTVAEGNVLPDICCCCCSCCDCDWTSFCPTTEGQCAEAKDKGFISIIVWPWEWLGELPAEEQISIARGEAADGGVDDGVELLRSSENRWSPSKWRIASTIVSRLFLIV